MDFKTRHLLITLLLPIISGCNLHTESEAVDLCFKQAPQVEAKRLETTKVNALAVLALYIGD